MTKKMPKVFLDSGNSEETKKAKELLGFLDGQTTNPSLVAKHPEAQAYLQQGKKLTKEELLSFYRQIINSIEKETDGAISVEVYADWNTTAQDMLSQAEEMYSWGKNIYMKFPTLPEGVKAAHQFVKTGGRVNMTLVFSQQQAASVYAATLPATQTAFISPFIARWDDRGLNGTDFLKNLITMYHAFDTQRAISVPHILVLAASIRTLNHLYASIFLGSDIVTIPLKLVQEWADNKLFLPDDTYTISSGELKPIPYEDILFNEDFSSYKLGLVEGDLVDEGIKKFATDWNSLVSK